MSKRWHPPFTPHETIISVYVLISGSGPPCTPIIISFSLFNISVLYEALVFLLFFSFNEHQKRAILHFFNRCGKFDDSTYGWFSFREGKPRREGRTKMKTNDITISDDVTFSMHFLPAICEKYLIICSIIELTFIWPYYMYFLVEVKRVVKL